MSTKKHTPRRQQLIQHRLNTNDVFTNTTPDLHIIKLTGTNTVLLEIYPHAIISACVRVASHSVEI